MTEPCALTRFDNLPLDLIMRARDRAVYNKTVAVNTLAEIDAEILKRYGNAFTDIFAAEQKESGTFTRELDGQKFKGSKSKKVEWDNAALQALASGMTWDLIQHYFKIDFKIPEAVFNAVPPGDLKTAFGKARTVKHGDLKIEPVADSAD